MYSYLYIIPNKRKYLHNLEANDSGMSPSLMKEAHC